MKAEINVARLGEAIDEFDISCQGLPSESETIVLAAARAHLDAAGAGVTDTIRDRIEAEERLNAIRDALHAVLASAKPVYEPTAVELLMALNMRGLKVVRAHA